MCGVTYKQLDFTKHPKHITRLLYYAWKTLLVLVSSILFILFNSSVSHRQDRNPHQTGL